MIFYFKIINFHGDIQKLSQKKLSYKQAAVLINLSHMESNNAFKVN